MYVEVERNNPKGKTVNAKAKIRITLLIENVDEQGNGGHRTYRSTIKGVNPKHLPLSKKRRNKMEKTLAREIYKKMEIGKEYATADLLRLVGDDYYKIVPVEFHPFQPNGKSAYKVVADEMWKVVKSGFARTRKADETVGNVRGLKFGTKPTSYTTYSVRYWVRTK